MTDGVTLRPATPQDAPFMVRLADIASDGLALATWRLYAPLGTDPYAYAEARARRDTGGFIWRSATIACWNGQPAALCIAYTLTAPNTPTNQLADPPAMLRPLLHLESLRIGCTYVSAIATDPAARGRGMATALLAAFRGPLCLICGDTNPALGLYRTLGFTPAASEPASGGAGWESPYRHWLLLDRAHDPLAHTPETR